MLKAIETCRKCACFIIDSRESMLCCYGETVNELRVHETNGERRFVKCPRGDTSPPSPLP